MTERRTRFVELFWDLVFVFAITQVTTFLSSHLSWGGFGRAMLLLALVWWAWSAFVWAANAEEEGSPTLRAVLLIGMVLIFIVGLALPETFEDGATLFAVAYTGVRLLHLLLYIHASRQGLASWQAIAGFSATAVIGMGLLVAGSFLPETPRTVMWLLAAGIDYAGPAWLTRGQLRGLQQVGVSHFAERYGLFVIICLGESVIAIGLSAEGQTIGVELVAAVVFGLLATIGLWWTYFDRFAGLAEARLREHKEPVLAAADAYSYLHLVIVAGIIIFAVGLKATIHHPGAALVDGARLALCGGTAVFLLGNWAFQMRMLGTAHPLKPIGAMVLAVLFAVSGGISATWVVAAITSLLALIAVLERRRDFLPTAS